MSCRKSALLVGLGKRAQPTTSRRLSAWVLYAAIVSITLFSLSIVTIFASYQGQDRRGAQRSPVFVESAESQNADVRVAFTLDRLNSQSLQFSVVYLDVSQPAFAPPPGLERWPQEGEVFLSPALHRVGKSEGIESRYGRFAGEISPEGLTHPDEYFAYVRPYSNVLENRAFKAISGFGKPTPTLIGSLLDRPSIALPLISLAGIVGIAIFLLLTVSLRMGLENRREQSSKLALLGASPFSRWRWHAGKIVQPILASLITSIVVICVLITWGIHLPLVDFTIPATDFRDAAPYFFSLTILVILSYALIWLALSVKEKKSVHSTRPSLVSESYDRRQAVICGLSGSSAVIVGLIGAGRNSTIAFGIFLVLASFMLATVKHLVGYTLISLVRNLRMRARTHNDPETLVSTAIIESRSASVSRLGVIVLLATLLSCVIYTVLSVFSQADGNSKAVYHRFENSVLEMRIRSSIDPARLPDFIEKAERALEADVVMLSEKFDKQSGEIVSLIAVNKKDCAGGEDFFAQSDRHMRELREYIRSRVANDESGAPRLQCLNTDEVISALNQEQTEDSELPQEWELAIISRQHNGLDVPGAKKMIASTFAPIPYMQTPEESWIVAQTSSLDRIRWTTLFSMVALAFVFLALAVIFVDERSDGLLRLVRASRQSGRAVKVWKIGALRVVLPLGIGAGAGLMLAGMFATTLILLYGEDIKIFLVFLPLIICVLAILGVVLWLFVCMQFNYFVKEYGNDVA